MDKKNFNQVNQFATYLSLRQYAVKSDAVTDESAYSQTDLDSLYETAVSLSSNLAADVLYEEIVRRGCKLADTNHGFIYVVNRDEEVLELKYGTGAYAYYLGVRRGKEEASVSSVVWRTGQPLSVDHLACWEGRAKDRPYGWDAVKSVLGIPLYSGYEVTAVIGLGAGVSKREFTVRDMDLLSRFAALASLALQNSQIYSNLQAKIAQDDRKRISQMSITRHRDLYGQEILLATRQNCLQADPQTDELADHSKIARGMWQTAQLHLADAYLSDSGENRISYPVQHGHIAEQLTEREKAVLRLIAAGLSNQEIALQTGVQVSTIKTHANHIFSKLGVKRRVQALVRARELGLI